MRYLHSEGHAGLTLILFSFLLMPFGYNENSLILIFLAAALSSLPDLDISWEIKHRGYTHNVTFGIIVGILFGILFGYQGGWAFGLIGFFGGLGGILSHLLGDLFTYQEFKPLWPFSKNEISFKWFSSKDRGKNRGFLQAGFYSVVLYILVSSGTLQEIMSDFL